MSLELRIATCRPLPEPDHDEPALLDALARAGIAARMVAWDDPAAWRGAMPTVIRSTWDYIHHLDRFRDWVDAVALTAPLWNPPAVVLGNLHKRYLIDLAAAGIPVVPTELVPHRDERPLTDICAARGWTDVVVKPAVGASSFGARRFSLPDDGDSAATHLAYLTSLGDALVQPYLASVDGHGERALVWIDGAFTHAVRKTPRFDGGDEHVSEAVAIEPDEHALGIRVMAVVAPGALYARVDVARDAAGIPLVMELELVEPSLFLIQHPPALDRLVAAIAGRLEAA